MQRSASTANSLLRKFMHLPNASKTHRNSQILQTILNPPSCDIFINHRGIDTKKTISGLLYQHLLWLGHYPFLDSRNMRPGDRIFDKIDPAIRRCKVGVAVFSPRYCESHFCLHELALLMETKKRVIPIFCDVKPSQLRVVNNGIYSTKELQRYTCALEDAKYTVGLTFDSYRGDWSEFLNMATDAVVKNLIEVEVEEATQKIRKYAALC